MLNVAISEIEKLHTLLFIILTHHNMTRQTTLTDALDSYILLLLAAKSNTMLPTNLIRA